MSELEPTPADAQSGGMTRIKVNYCVDEGEYEFETECDRDQFVSNPTFNFDFDIDNVDDKDGVERVFGTLDVAPHFSRHSPEFTVTRVEPSEDNGAVAIVSVEVEMFFDIRISLADFLEWVEGEGDTWRYSGRIECAGEIGLINSEREEYESYLEVTGILNPPNTGAACDIVQSVTEQLAGATGLAIFISEDTNAELVDSLICNLEDDGALIVQIEAGASYMDYIAPLMEAEEGRTAILDGVQHIEEELIGDFLRIVSDRVLVGTIGEGDGAKSFEVPMSAFNLVLIDRGGGETSLIRDTAKRTMALQNDPQVRLPRENYYVSYLQAAQISDDLSSYASDGDALIGFCYSDEGIFVDKDGNIFGEDGTRSIDLVFAISDEVYAYSGYLYNSEKSEFVSGFHEGDEAHEDGRAQLVDKISSHINMSDDAISDMLYAVSCNQDDDFSEMFDDAKDTDWEYTFGSGDVISCDADEAQGRVFVELYPPVLLSASQSETGVIEFDEDAHVEGRNEELRFVGICLE